MPPSADSRPHYIVTNYEPHARPRCARSHRDPRSSAVDDVAITTHAAGQDAVQLYANQVRGGEPCIIWRTGVDASVQIFSLEASSRVDSQQLAIRFFHQPLGLGTKPLLVLLRIMSPSGGVG